MRIVNLTKKTILAENIFIAKTVREKTRGLIGVDCPRPLFFKTRWGIHTFGMNFAIDCVVCDKTWQVGKIRENLAPGHFFFWWPAFSNVLELPAGTISKTGTVVGDKLATGF